MDWPSVIYATNLTVNQKRIALVKEFVLFRR